MHSIGIFNGNLNKNTIVNDKGNIKLTDFSKAEYVNEINKQFLLNNPYCKPCLNIEELFELELSIVDEIFYGL